MLKSFKQRLAELEALEAEVEVARPLDEADADDLDDDEVLAEACYGLGGGCVLTTWNTGIFRLTFSNEAFGPRYWQRVAERAQTLCDARGIVLFPLTAEDAHAAIDAIRRGVFTIQPRPSQSEYSHHSCIRFPYNTPDWSARFEQQCRLARALDTWLWQQRRHTGTPIELLSTADEVLSLLEAVGGEA